jgi:hypothetical protein
MVKNIVFIHAFCLALILIINRVYSQDVDKNPVRLMFYNVENLFDISDDSLTEDNDFLPDGVMRWNYSRYKRKITSLYKTIAAAGSPEPPGIVAMCEVENMNVLKDLVYGTYLSKFKYRIVHEESPDIRGIDVCLIYRSEDLRLLDFRYWIPKSIKIENFTTRSILYARFVINCDTLHLIVNHWPSRRGGVLAGEDLRTRISGMVREKADSIARCSSQGQRIIITGDFNCTPDDQEIRSLIYPVHPEDHAATLENLSEKPSEDGRGTYRYRGSWEMIDQVIVSDFLVNCRKGMFTNPKQLAIFDADFLLAKDPKYPGLSPLSTYRGYTYQGGYSDHLPVLLDLRFR